MCVYAGGPELRNDAAVLSQALSRTSPDGLHTSLTRQIIAYVTTQPPSFHVPPKVAAAAWSSTAIAQLTAQVRCADCLVYLPLTIPQLLSSLILCVCSHFEELQCCKTNADVTMTGEYDVLSAYGSEYCCHVWRDVGCCVQPGLYAMLLYLADHPNWPELCRPAQRLLDLLPTHADVVHQLAAALDTSATDEAALKLHSLLQSSHQGNASDMVLEETPVDAGTAQSPYDMHAVVKPARMTYMLQALHGLLYPSPTALQCILQSQKELQRKDAVATETSDAGDVAGGTDDLAPNTVRRLPTVAACLPVLYSLLRRSAAAVSSTCASAHDANSSTSLLTLQVLEFHAQLVQLLNNLCQKDTVQALQGIEQCKGYAAMRPLPLELVLVSAHAHSPSTGGTQGALGTPTGPMQGLSVAGGSTPEAEDPSGLISGGHSAGAADAQRMSSTATQALSAGAAHAVAVVGAAASALPSVGGVPSPPFSGGHLTMCETDASDAAAAAAGYTLHESPAQTLVGLLVTTSCQAVSLLRRCSVLMTQQGVDSSGDSTYNAVCSQATQVGREGLQVLQRMLAKMPELYSAFLNHQR